MRDIGVWCLVILGWSLLLRLVLMLFRTVLTISGCVYLSWYFTLYRTRGVWNHCDLSCLRRYPGLLVCIRVILPYRLICLYKWLYRMLSLQADFVYLRLFWHWLHIFVDIIISRTNRNELISFAKATIPKLNASTVQSWWSILNNVPCLRLML